MGTPTSSNMQPFVTAGLFICSVTAILALAAFSALNLIEDHPKTLIHASVSTGTFSHPVYLKSRLASTGTFGHHLPPARSVSQMPLSKRPVESGAGTYNGFGVDGTDLKCS